MLFEKGYEYDLTYSIPGENYPVTYSGSLNGESALTPALISSYGDSGEAILKGHLNGNGARNAVVQDVNIIGEQVAIQGGDDFIGGVKVYSGHHILFEDINVSNGGITVQVGNTVTLRNSSSIDAIRENSDIVDGVWNGHRDRMAGVYVSGIDGLLIENNFIDHAGWGEGFDPNLSESAPQPPSLYSHNVYIQNSSTDVTFRDNISMRASSFGVQVRPGGFIEDNVFLDNNVAVGFTGGSFDGDEYVGPIGHYSLFVDNVITSAGNRLTTNKDYAGATTWGVVDDEPLETLLDNIIAHLADPNNPAELAEKTDGRNIAINSNPNIPGGNGHYFNDTIIYNWNTQQQVSSGNIKNPDTNVDGLDKAVLNQTTIQNYAADLLGQETATIDDLANYLRAQANGQLDNVVTADLIIAFFQQGFGLTPDLNHQATTQQFTPDDLGDGMRWDNRLNWSEDYLPTEGQDIEFAGNWVYYAGAGTNRVGDLDLGAGGRLTTNAGKLTVTGDLTSGENGGTLEIGNVGQIWIDGYSDYDQLNLDITGGRFANTGLINGRLIDVNFSAGQAMLATQNGQFDLTEGSRIEITGDAGKIGFDGSQGELNILRLMKGSTLAMTADDTGVSTIGEFRSGAYGDTVSNPSSGITLGGTLELDLSAYAGAKNLTLMKADEIIGAFDDVTITGLSSGKNATLITDYDANTVSIQFTNGTGVFTEQTNGAAPSQSNTDQQLWGALNQTFLSRTVHSSRTDGNENVDVYVNGVLKTATIVDVTNSGMWQSYEHHYTPDKKLIKLVSTADSGVVTTYHNQDGVRRAIESKDVTDATDWEYAYTSLAANGDKIEEYRLYDDMREESTRYVDGVKSVKESVDNGEANAWSKIIEKFDPAGVTTAKTTLFDSSRLQIELFVNGKRALLAELDQADEFAWQARASSYDSAGKRAEYSEFSDEGQMKTTEYATSDPRDSLLDLYDAFLFENGQFVADPDSLLI